MACSSRETQQIKEIMQKYKGKNFIVGRVSNCDVRCDRSTPYGNRYRMLGHSDNERRRVCQLHRRRLWEKIQQRETLTIALLQNLSDAQRKKGSALVLGCHCAPRLCHCDAIAGAVDYCRKENIIR